MREHAYFIDEQRIGPYHFWYHEHEFKTVAGGPRMLDNFTCSIGFVPMGDALNELWIVRRLKGIFDFRAQKIKEIFAGRSIV